MPIRQRSTTMTRRMCSTILLLALGCALAPAQDIRKVIEVVGELEDSVKVMIAKEGKQRDADVSALRAEIASLRKVIDQLAAARAAAKDTVLVHLPPKPAGPAESFPSIKVGALVQMQGFGAQEQTTAAQDADPAYRAHWQRQLYIRRVRFLAGGNISQSTSFFFESDAPNLGKTSTGGVKSITVNMYVQDAYIQHMFAPQLGLVAGLQLVGITRNGLQSAASLMPVNYGTYQFLPSTPLDNTVGRDVGFAARGFLLDERLEYRLGMYSGKNLNLSSPPRYALRLNYNFLDREKGFFYTGTTLGKSQLLAVGGGVDLQGTYSGYALDCFVDIPLFEPGSITASASYCHLDGGGSATDSTFFTGQIPKQNVLFAEAGYYLKDLGLQPCVKYEAELVRATVWKQVGATSDASLDLQNHLRSGSRYGAGAGYYLNGHGMSFKFLFEHVIRNRITVDKKSWETVGTNELTFQVQYFTF